MRLPNYWFRSARTGRFVNWAFAQKNKAETVQETWVPRTTTTSTTGNTSVTYVHVPRDWRCPYCNYEMIVCPNCASQLTDDGGDAA